MKPQSPYYLLEESKLRDNLRQIREVADLSGVKIILALKASAMWSIFPIIREYFDSATASSAAEARLIVEKFGAKSHSYAPTYTDRSFKEIIECSSHITFNSLGQLDRFRQRSLDKGVSIGLRVNPEYSTVETDLYNPCSAGSRLGVKASDLDALPKGVEGLHFHSLCESRPADLAATLESFETKFAHLLPHVKWVNMGGGHLITHKDYDANYLIEILKGFKSRHPHLKVILEPGSAFTWQTGYLVSTIEDIVCNDGVPTAMLDVSFACHMPDCLEMPYTPTVRGAREATPDEKGWRLGGNSCLAGDFMGEWIFENEPQVGDELIFEDMIHYTMVKTTMFNGVHHPSIAIEDLQGDIRVVREFGYEDFRDRMG